MLAFHVVIITIVKIFIWQSHCINLPIGFIYIVVILLLIYYLLLLPLYVWGGGGEGIGGRGILGLVVVLLFITLGSII